MSSYEVVRRRLKELIASQNLAAGDRLPSEVALAKQFGVSRSVLRETYRLLEKDGLITVRNGAGAYVGSSLPVISSSLNDLNSTGMIIKRAGYDTKTEVLALRHCEPLSEWAEKLRMEAGALVVVAKRLRSAGGTAIALSWNIFPEKLVGAKLDKGIGESIFQQLERECQIAVASAHTRIAALDVNYPYDLEAKTVLGERAVSMQRLHFAGKGEPVFYSLDYMRTDLVELTIQQERREF
jgi:GntR family transcriptional regulator